MAAPLVSILIPSYKPRHFELALTSALAQAYDNKEIIVSDDCPTDDIERLCAPYPHVQYSRNPDSRDPNRPPNSNLRRLTRLANGEYLKYLMDDDILHPLCVGRMVEAFGGDTGVKLVFSARDRIDADNRLISQARTIQAEGPAKRLPGQTLRKHCISRLTNIVGEFTTVMFRKADVHRAGQAEPIYTSYRGDPIVGLTDIATFLQLCDDGDAVYIADALSLFRIHQDANTQNVASPGFIAGAAEWALFTKHACEDPAFSAEEKRTAVANARERFGRWSARFPQLAPQVALLDELAGRLQGEGGSVTSEIGS